MELSNQQTFKCSNDRLTISFASYEHAISVNDSQGNSLVIDVTPEQMTASFLKSVGDLSINYHESKRQATCWYQKSSCQQLHSFIKSKQ